MFSSLNIKCVIICQQVLEMRIIQQRSIPALRRAVRIFQTACHLNDDADEVGLDYLINQIIKQTYGHLLLCVLMLFVFFFLSLHPHDILFPMSIV